MRRWWLGIVGLAGIGAAVAAGVWRSPVAEGDPVAEDAGPPDIVLIVVDTLRADHLGVYGYDADVSPRIDAFARENLRFSFAIASAPWTAPSVASIFTGVYPTAHGVWLHTDPRVDRVPRRLEASVLRDGFRTLAEALGSAGYHTACVTANPWVEEGLGFAQGFDVFESLETVEAAVVNERGLRFVDEVRRVGDPERPPFFLYLHYMDPHTPYRERPRPDLGAATRARYPRSELPFLEQYDAEIAYLDEKIGELFDALRARGLYEDAVVLFTSDHGEQFMERGRRGHGHHVFNPEVHVPLVLKARGLRGEVEAAVGLVDLYPTLLELAGVPAGEQPQGVSLLDGERLAGRGVFSEMTRQRNHKAFTRSDGKKLILSYREPRGALVAEADSVVGLFDSRRDPLEQEPLDDPALLSEMKEDFYALYSESVVLRRKQPSVTATLPEETERELRALGYLEGAPEEDGAPGASTR